MGRPRRVRPVPVVPFAPTRDVAVRPVRGVLLRFPAILADGPPDDGARNAAWDDLLALVDRAWTWRDPDSLSAVEACFLQLARDVTAEWAGPEADA
jgi:hypothetical protein